MSTISIRSQESGFNNHLQPNRVSPIQRFQLVWSLSLIRSKLLKRFKWIDVVEGIEYLHSLDPALVHGDLKLVKCSTFGFGCPHSNSALV
jgi:hypothetical protein